MVLIFLPAIPDLISLNGMGWRGSLLVEQVVLSVEDL